MVSQPIGTLGPRDGPAVQVQCPPSDTLRVVAAVPVLVLLLVLRKANRVKESWRLLISLAGLYFLLGAAERLLNGYLLFHYHQYICSSLADLLWFFGLSLAIVLAIAASLHIPWRVVRFVIVTLLVFLANSLQIAANPWPFLDSGKWAMLFGFFLVVFMIGNAIVRAVLRRLAGPNRFGRLYGWFCLVLGVVPLLVLWVAEAVMSRSVQLQSTQEMFRMLVLFTAAICLPYVVFWVFLLPALIGPRTSPGQPYPDANDPGAGGPRGSPWLGERFARAFGVRHLALESAAGEQPAVVEEALKAG